MSDLNQAQGQNLRLVADAPPTQPQGSPEAPLEKVRHEAELLLMLEGEEALHEIYSHFKVKSADDLSETNRREFIRLAKMNGEDRADAVRTKRTAPPPIAVEPNGNTTIPMRDRAIALAKLGFRVFPLKPNSKLPAVKKFHEVASSDPAAVARLWSNGSTDCNIGISTDDLLVLDVDNKNGKQGDASLAKLVVEYGLDTNTAEAVTPTGGRHLFYKLPPGVTVANNANKLAPDVDVRGFHGYVVGAGSVLPAGEYEWVVEPGAPGEVDRLSLAPPELIAACGAPRTRQQDIVNGLEPDSVFAVGRAVRFLKHAAPGAVEGEGGNTTTYQVACRVKDFGITEQTCLELLVEHWNDQKAEPPWDVEELAQVVENAYHYGKDPIGIKSVEAHFDRVELETVADETGAAEKASHIPLTLAEWEARELADPDFICGNWLTTTTRALLVAPTGLGKTMFGLGLTMAPAAGRDFLHWKGVRPAKVLFIDGEMSNRLLRERLRDEVRRLGVASETFYALSHEDVPGGLPPLNTPGGQAVIEAVMKKVGGVDLINFDNTMSLIAGDNREEEGWRQTLPWVLSLTRRKIGQIWVHHTGHDESRTYGTKTREWQMDTVMHLVRVKRTDTDVSFELQFRKARERRPENREDFKTISVALVGDKWTASCVTGFEDFRHATTPAEDDWWEQLDAWTKDERKRLGLRPETEVSITVEVAQKVFSATQNSADDRIASANDRMPSTTVKNRMTALTEKGLLRKIKRGQWVVVNDRE